MGNDIARQFAHLPAAEAAEAIARHIETFWDPRMRRTLEALVAAHDDVPRPAPRRRRRPPGHARLPLRARRPAVANAAPCLPHRVSTRSRDCPAHHMGWMSSAMAGGAYFGW